MIEWDKPIETVDGRPAKVISTGFRYGNEVAVVLQIEYELSSVISHYAKNGYPKFGAPEIRNRKTKREAWINIYDGYTGSCPHSTEALAKKHAAADVKATIKIEWEEQP